ncbi:hypothetical protein ACHHYP_00270 [Achlya hypogyna]|uniref:Transmembrane protein n=1 Tax=Achlya hypogyna TaxID=1202772 RepID=A0A1V9ZUN0_ACHHY|nr:hypothetical protein ACHHYP_00270 [Achlya hypogyna]
MLRKVRQLYVALRRLLACLAALLVVYIEYLGSTGNRTVLAGGLLPAAPGNSYASPLLEPFLRTLLTTGYALPAPPALRFLEATSTGVGLFPACATLLQGDRIYTEAHLTLVLHNLLRIPINDSVLLVDCEYTGRATEDTTALKVHALDATTLTTVFLQTMSMSRPAKHRTASCGTATVSVISLAAVDVDTMHVTGLVADNSSAAVNDIYTTLVGIDFPYETVRPFEKATLATAVTDDGAWVATVGDEVVSLRGSEGIFRGSVDLQANYDYYVWALPTNPLDFVRTIDYIDASHTKDGFAWLRLCFGVGIGLHVFVALVVAIVTSVNLFRDTGAVWVPDLFPCIEYRVRMRAALCAGGLWLTGWWHVFEWSLAETNDRLGFTGTFVYPAMALTDAVMVALALVSLWAHALEVRVGLEAVLAALYVCYVHRAAIAVGTGWCLDAADAYATANFAANSIATGAGGMDLWTVHEDLGTDMCVIVSAFVWWLVAVAGICAYVLMIKLAAVARSGAATVDRDRVQPRGPRASLRKVAAGTDDTPIAPTEHPRLRQWHLRSLLYAPYDSDDDEDSTQVERSTRTRLADVHGLVAATDDPDDGKMAVSGVWLLGHILLDDTHLVSISDYPRWFVNAVCNRRIFRVYGHRVRSSDTSLYKELVLLDGDRLWTELAPLTLRPLR